MFNAKCERVTITLPNDLLAVIQDAADTDTAGKISTYIQLAATEKLVRDGWVSPEMVDRRKLIEKVYETIEVVGLEDFIGMLGSAIQKELVG